MARRNRTYGRPNRDAKFQYLNGLTHRFKSIINTQRGLMTSPRRCPIGINHNLAHEILIASVTEAVAVLMVDRIVDMGVEEIHINLGLSPWTDDTAAVIAKYDAIIDRIRNTHGLTVNFGFLYTGAVHTLTSMAEWTAAAIPVMETITTRYTPDCFNVCREPTSQAARMGFTPNVAEWETFVESAAAAVLAISPNTKIMAGGLDTEADYIEAFLGITDVDEISLHVYESDKFTEYEAIIADIKTAGKPFCIGETWRDFFLYIWQFVDLSQASFLWNGDNNFEELDRLWIEAMQLWATNQGARMVMPFWSNQFFYYGPRATNSWSPNDLTGTGLAIVANEHSSLFDKVAELNALV